ncbi:MAG TPA: translocation/assembly module TamB domain-containing protein, partial [Armatimonadota bacterium]
TGQLVTTRTLSKPLIDGHLVVTNALLQLPANIVETSVQIPLLPINPALSITLELSRDVVIERGGLKATVRGPVTFAGAFPRPLISGTVQIVNGRLSYVGTTLEIMPGGTASFVLQPPLPAVMTVDLTLTTRLTGISPITKRATRYAVYIDLSGPLSRLDVSVRSNPPGLSETQALGSVFGGASLSALQQGTSVPQFVQQQFGQVILGLAVPALVPPFTLGPFTFSLGAGFEVPLEFTASVPLTDKTALAYTSSIVGKTSVGGLDFSYSLSRNFALDLQFSGQNNSSRETILLIQYFTRFR